MKNRMAFAIALLVALSVTLAACGSPATPTPTPAPTAVPTPEPTAIPTTEAFPTTLPPGDVDVAWLSVIKPEVPAVARVNGTDVTTDKYLKTLRQQLQQVTLQYGVDWNDPENISLLPGFQDEVLQQMVQEELARQLAAAEGLVVDDARREAERTIITENILLSGQYENWEAFLAAMGWTPEAFEEALDSYLVFTLLEEAHGGSADSEQVHAAHILVETEETGNEVLAKLAAGEDFAALAAQYSIDTSNKDTGGDLGWFPRGAMVTEFENAAFSMEPGQTSELVQTQFGYHIIFVFGKETRPLEGDALAQVQQQNFNNWFGTEMGNATLETLAEFAPTES